MDYSSNDGNCSSKSICAKIKESDREIAKVIID